MPRFSIKDCNNSLVNILSQYSSFIVNNIFTNFFLQFSDRRSCVIFLISLYDSWFSIHVSIFHKMISILFSTWTFWFIWHHTCIDVIVWIFMIAMWANWWHIRMITIFISISISISITIPTTSVSVPIVWAVKWLLGKVKLLGSIPEVVFNLHVAIIPLLVEHASNLVFVVHHHGLCLHLRSVINEISQVLLAGGAFLDELLIVFSLLVSQGRLFLLMFRWGLSVLLFKKIVIMFGSKRLLVGNALKLMVTHFADTLSLRYLKLGLLVCWTSMLIISALLTVRRALPFYVSLVIFHKLPITRHFLLNNFLFLNYIIY